MYQFNLPNLKVLHILQSRQLLDCWFAKILFINLAFQASDIRIERNLKALLMKTTESLGGKAERKILSSINKNFGWSYSVVIKA